MILCNIYLSNWWRRNHNIVREGAKTLQSKAHAPFELPSKWNYILQSSCYPLIWKVLPTPPKDPLFYADLIPTDPPVFHYSPHPMTPFFLKNINKQKFECKPCYDIILEAIKMNMIY